MNVAVTGASGHIGSCLTRDLIKQGHVVKVLVRKKESYLLLSKVEFVLGDLNNLNALSELCENTDVVFHLAAKISLDNQNAKEVFATNVRGTKNIIEAAKSAGVKKFIHFSSIHAFQAKAADELLDENRPLIDKFSGVYEQTKAESEKIVLDAVSEGLNAVILSPTAVIGPFDFRGSFMGEALLKIYTNKLPMLIAGGYNWVDVRDIVNAALKAVDQGRTGEKYILSGNYCSLKQLSALIGKISGKKTPQMIVPIWLARLVFPLIYFYSLISKKAPYYTRQSLDIIAQSSKNISYRKAQKELDYHPRTLEQTLRDTFIFYKQHNNLNSYD